MKFFDKLHPAAAFIYFVVVVTLTMFTSNPLVVGASFVFGVAFCCFYFSARDMCGSLLLALPMMIVIALINPLFVHKGDTILFFLNDNPVTKEAILYGVNMSVTITAVYYWCKAYNRIVTSDKFVYLFGRVSPKLSLLLSLVIGFVPRLKRKYKEIDEAQKALGVYARGGYTDKLASKFRVLSILVTDALESSVMTADSMASRGYGLRGRTSYSPFTFAPSDVFALLFVLATGVAAIVLGALKYGAFYFYPTLTELTFGAKECIFYVCVACVFAYAALTEIGENLRWSYLKSTI